MEVSDILHGMCSRDLSNADIKTICKYRGFSEKEASSRALFENFFLSDRGVEKAMASLGDAEAQLLHLLKLLGEPVNITFFERIYESAKSTGWYLTFTQEYQEVFKQVKLLSGPQRDPPNGGRCINQGLPDSKAGEVALRLSPGARAFSAPFV